MKRINEKLLNSFNRLEQLCNEKYGVKHGVTYYIDEMKKTPYRLSRRYDNWDQDLQMLVRIRHIRNKLSHGELSFDDDCCEQKDVDFLNRFSKAIESQCDPLSIIKAGNHTAGHYVGIVVIVLVIAFLLSLLSRE